MYSHSKIKPLFEKKKGRQMHPSCVGHPCTAPPWPRASEHPTCRARWATAASLFRRGRVLGCPHACPGPGHSAPQLVRLLWRCWSPASGAAACPALHIPGSPGGGSCRREGEAAAGAGHMGPRPAGCAGARPACVRAGGRNTVHSRLDFQRAPGQLSHFVQNKGLVSSQIVPA